MKICNQCKIEKSEDCFHKFGKRLYYICKECRRNKERLEHKNNFKKKEKLRIYRGKIRELKEKTKDKGCLYCGEKDICCLDFHHINPKEKSFSIGHSHKYSLEALKIEISKCIVICSNCHKKLHADRKLAPLV